MKMTLSIKPEMVNKIKQVSEATGRTYSGLVEVSLNEFFNKNETEIEKYKRWNRTLDKIGL